MGPGISLNQFLQLTGLTGFFVEPAQPGLTMPNQMGSWMTYFRVWDTDKDANVTADGLKNLLRARLKSMPEEYVGWYRLLVYVDVDCEPQEYPSPYQAGLTPHAICFDVNLADVEQLFPDIDRACATLSTLAQRNMRIGIGSFAQQEYDGFRKHSIYTKCMPYGMGTEWILFKNIRSRAGKFGWFWRLVAKWRDRTDK